jgi:tetratricopeptide (TPR) repeat protein
MTLSPLMEYVLKTAFILFFGLIIAQISFAKEIKITSTPSGAEVWVRPIGNLNFQKVGETPYVAEVKNIVDTYTKTDVFVIELRKADHQYHRYIMSDLSNADIEISTKLELQDDYSLMLKVDDASQGMFEAQRLMRAKNYDAAITKLDEILKKFPRLSILYELKGTALYLSKKPIEALEQYKEAFKYNPQNFDAFKMKEYLEKTIQNGDAAKQ